MSQNQNLDCPRPRLAHESFRVVISSQNPTSQHFQPLPAFNEASDSYIAASDSFKTAPDSFNPASDSFDDASDSLIESSENFNLTSENFKGLSESFNLTSGVIFLILDFFHTCHNFFPIDFFVTLFVPIFF